MLGGLRARDVLGVVRAAQHDAAALQPLVVDGVLANELARSLTAGGDAGLVRVGGDPAGASVYVLSIAGEASRDDVRRLRQAARAVVPVVAVQTDPYAAGVELPYVLATSVVICTPGRGFPVGEIARVIARLASHSAASLPASLPAVRDAFVRELVNTASTQTAALGLVPFGKRAHYPLMTLAQARLVLDLAAAFGRPVGQERAPELGVVIATGLGMRALARKLPVPGLLLAGLTGYAATRALGEAASRRYAARF